MRGRKTKTGARPLTLEALQQQKRPATTAVSSREEVAYIIEPRFNPDHEVTADRRGTIEGEVFVWTESQAPPRALGKGTDFLKYSPDGAWLATAVAKGDGYVFRLISRDDGSVADIGWTDRGFFSCGWTSTNQFVYRESLPAPDDTMHMIDTLNESLDPISRLVLFDPRTGVPIWEQKSLPAVTGS